MKYNKSKIMKRAWELKKSWNCRALTFGQCLKMAWQEAKTEIENNLVPTVFTNGMEITVDGYTRILNRWTKGSHDRVYINGGGRRGDGWVDVKTGVSNTNNLSYANKMVEKILAMEF